MANKLVKKGIVNHRITRIPPSKQANYYSTQPAWVTHVLGCWAAVPRKCKESLKPNLFDPGLPVQPHGAEAVTDAYGQKHIYR